MSRNVLSAENQETSVDDFFVRSVFSKKRWNSLLSLTLLERKRWRLAIVFLSLTSAIFGLLGPLFQKLFVDRLLGSAQTIAPGVQTTLQSWPTIMLVVCAFLSIVLSQATGMFGLYLGAREAIFLQRLFSHFVFKKALRLRPDTMRNRTVGEIVSLYATDCQAATALLEQSLPVGSAILFPLLLGPIAIHVLFGIPLWSALLATGIVFAINILLSFRQARFFAKFKSLAADRTGLVGEWIQNIRALRILGWTESFESKIYRKRVEETENRVRMVTNGQFMSSIGSSVNFFMSVLGVASLVYIRGGNVTAGELLAFLWILGVFLARPFRQVPWMFTFMLDALTSVKRLEELFAIPTYDKGEENWKTTSSEAIQNRPSGDLKVVDLNLKLGDASLLSHVSLEIPESSFVAIVGEVGSGKSLLALSLMGETQAEFSAYKLGEVDMLKLSSPEKRTLFSYVPQEGFVMSASLRDNVAFEYEAPKSDDPAIFESLGRAQFHLDLENVEGGIETEIGERGVNLSGGQRQRVSLARAHFHDRPVVILDDSLSAVDVDTERKLLHELIKKDWSGRIRILITHRLSVLQLVDQILFMKDGTIIDQGTFSDLFNRSPYFREFVRTLEIKHEKTAEKGENFVESIAETATAITVDTEVEP